MDWDLFIPRPCCLCIEDITLAHCTESRPRPTRSLQRRFAPRCARCSQRQLRRAEPHQWPTRGGSIPPAPHHPEGLTPKLGAPSSLLSDDAIETASVQVTHSGVAQVELPGIEPELLPGSMPSELQFRYVTIRFSPARYLRFRSRVLTASRAGNCLRELPVHTAERWRRPAELDNPFPSGVGRREPLI